MIGLYLHIPYCTVRCSYCDFYLVPVRGRDPAAYGAALQSEIATAGRDAGRPAADTLHFGGGTPSLLPAEAIARLVAASREAFRMPADAEIALEANPEDLDDARLEGLRVAGVNRLTIGVQSLDDALLRLMRRPHDARRAVAVVSAARRAGFANLAADLILGLSGQRDAAALADVARLADLGIDHLSLYLLEVHERTRLGRAVALGRMEVPPADDVARLYEKAADLLLERGFEHYEISNFARPGSASRHNLKYWTDQEYLGFGPSAHSYRGGERWSNRPDLAAYIASGGIGHPRVADTQPRATRGGEALCAGLRLLQGVDLLALRARYGDRLPAPGDAVIGLLETAGLVTLEGVRLRLTRRGRLVSNEVFERLWPERG